MLVCGEEIAFTSSVGGCAWYGQAQATWVKAVLPLLVTRDVSRGA